MYQLFNKIPENDPIGEILPMYLDDGREEAVEHVNVPVMNYFDAIECKLVQYEHVRQVGYCLELALWKSCLFMLLGNELQDESARKRGRANSLSMLPLILRCDSVLVD